MNGVVFAGGGTGGHLYPALALADAISSARPQTDIYFVGAKRGVEARVLPAENRPHTLLPFEPLRRSEVWQNWRLIPSVSAGKGGEGSPGVRRDATRSVASRSAASGLEYVAAEPTSPTHCSIGHES